MDIVKRLRAMDEEQFYQAPATSYRDCQEAADEIEKLRLQYGALRKAIFAIDGIVRDPDTINATL